MRIATQGGMLLTSPGPERVQTMGCGRAECLSGLTFSSCDSHKSNVATLPPLRSPECQEDVLCPQTPMKAEQVQPRSSCDSHKSNVATLPPLRSPERQEDVLWPQSSMKAEQVQPRLRAANSLLFALFT